jgi:hypothetical protein
MVALPYLGECPASSVRWLLEVLRGVYGGHEVLQGVYGGHAEVLQAVVREVAGRSFFHSGGGATMLK